MNCKKKLTLEEIELAVLRSAVDKIEQKTGKKLLHNPEIQEIIHVVENFLQNRKRICYGGTAINNILPLEDQFYNKEIELPDYDFFSPDPLKDAKDLADIYYKAGFEEVEAKSGAHAGTFKVFVNFMPVADITLLNKELYTKLHKDAIVINGIYYTPPNYLRMLMYLELSRPLGDASRWEKVLKRLTLLNKNYPLKAKNCNVNEIQRLFESDSRDKYAAGQKYDSREIFDIVRNSLIQQQAIFFGAYANRLYIKKMPYFHKQKILKIPDFDVLSNDPEGTARIVKRRLLDIGIKNVKIKKKNGVGEVIAPHYEVIIGRDTIVFIYEPMACHSYNIIHYKGKKIRIATLDTMLSFYLAFYYVQRPYYDPHRILCMSDFLFKVQQKNRLSQKGLLKRFSIDCYGEEHHTKEKSRSKKSEMYRKLKNKKGSKEWEWWFLNYAPGTPTTPRRKTRKKKKKKKKKTRKKRGVLANLLL